MVLTRYDIVEIVIASAAGATCTVAIIFWIVIMIVLCIRKLIRRKQNHNGEDHRKASAAGSIVEMRPRVAHEQVVLQEEDAEIQAPLQAEDARSEIQQAKDQAAVCHIVGPKKLH